MKFSFRLWVALIGVAIAVVQPQLVLSQIQPLGEQSIAQITPPQEAAIGSFARDVTVVINGQNPGSGVIISKQGNTYYVLTAKHVVATQDEYEIVTSDATKHPLNYSTVKKLPGVDLAVVQFTSNKNYRIALLGDSETATEGATVYISGWPHPGRAITQRIYQITKGSISGRPLESLEDGYGLVYTNITRSGMSGGPVWDAQGRVIGIHGRGDRETGDSETELTGGEKTGFNLGIPINSFLKLASQNGIHLSYLLDNFAVANTLLSDKRCLEKLYRYTPVTVSLDNHNQMMAIALESGSISLCNRTTGKELQTLEGHYRRIHSLLFSPDGKTLASIGNEEKDRDIDIIKIWKVNTGQLLHTFITDNQIYTYSPTFSPDSKTFASGHGKIIRIWNLNTGKLLHELDNDDIIWGLAIRPDSQILASGSFGGTIKIWNLGTGQLLRTLPGHSTPVDQLKFSPSGQILVSGSVSSTDMFTNGSPRGKVDDATIKIWNWQTGELLWTLIDNSGSILSLAIEPYGQILASSSKDEIKIWNLQTGQLLRTLDAGKPVESLAFSADGQTLFSDNFDYETQVWQLAKP